MKKPKQFILIAVLSIAIITGAIIFYQKLTARGASYGWSQTDWSGGASTTAEAVHPGDETGWTYYYSKDALVSTSTVDEISLASTTASWTETDTADFDAGTQNSVYATSGAVFLLKPAGATCSLKTECIGGYCNGSSACDTCVSFTYEDQTYSVVIIGEQCWMAENLNVGSTTDSVNTGSDHSDMSNDSIIEKYCYDNDTANCDTYGGLYDWDEMMGYVETAGTQGICPSGWHIPTDGEQYELENYLKDDGETCVALRPSGTWDCATAGTKFKSGGTSGFGGLLAGFRYRTGSFGYLASRGSFWSSSVSGSNAWSRRLGSTESRVDRHADNQTSGFSVRCVKD